MTSLRLQYYAESILGFEVADQNARSRAAAESSVRYSISAAEWRGTTA
ncbi:hypothetical protein HMPREF3227_01852 [Corynebacterium sp. CMW7794]|nr:MULTISPECIES: hypothetical protein [Corynebacterium]KXI16787.1 hypothetical protein HMPREF3227_01852 [Corynebacterium sp. CMW7794]MBF9010289.1 hypothetical protein [Corynebacterium phoceense]